MNWHSFWFNLGRSFLMIADTYVPNAVSLGNHSAITPMEQRSDPNSHGRQCPDVSLFIQCDKLFRALFFLQMHLKLSSTMIGISSKSLRS